jgi:hypothetical protein
MKYDGMAHTFMKGLLALRTSRIHFTPPPPEVYKRVSKSVLRGRAEHIKKGETKMEPSENLYRKKPIVIEARQLSEENCVEIAEWVLGRPVIDNRVFRSIARRRGGLYIPTLEGDMLANLGDFIIKGINGEFYPCKSDIFEKTYEKV